jgi:putative DNA primase/helicase
MANIHDDLEEHDVKRFGKLKQLTGGSRVRAREIYGKPFDFWNKAKLIYACNKIPPAGRADDAYYGRWVIIPMMRQFWEGAEADEMMDDKLKSPLELSGILNLAITGLLSLEANHGFCYPTDPRAHKCRYLAYSGDVVARFVSECFVYEDEITPKQTVLEYYRRYCERIDIAPVDETSFFIHLADYLDDRVADCRPTLDGVRVPSWRGLRVVLPKRTQLVERFHFTGVSLNPRTFTDD